MAETIREAYIRRSPKSAELYPRFKNLFPSGGGGHDGYVAAPFPVSIARGLGPRKWDVDGNEYIDYGMGSASLLLGHAHPDVVEALVQVAPNGSHFGGPVESVLEWGERVISLIPCADRVRFVGSGAESTMLAMRVARAFTGKEKIIRWESHYHGWHDYVMPGNLPPFDVPASTGIPQGTIDSVIVLPPDLGALERALNASSDIAGVITEGSGASYGTVPLPPGFIEGVRRLTQQHGVVMILDEVITGFRWSPGGLQQKIDVIPDLCTMAKILTGGMPGGAVAGRQDIMAVMEQTGDPDHDRYQRVSSRRHLQCQSLRRRHRQRRSQAGGHGRTPGPGRPDGRQAALGLTGNHGPAMKSKPQFTATLPRSTFTSGPGPLPGWTPTC